MGDDMNILVVGGGSWDDTSSLGNTFSNFFADWKDTNFYNLYFRDTRPNNSVCNNYFKITTKELLKKFFTPNKIGEEFSLDEMNLCEIDSAGEKEKKAISFIHRHRMNSVYELEDRLWYLKKWKNEKFDKFIAQVNPDIIFSFAAGESYLTFCIEYIKLKTNAKLVLFVADNLYTTYRLKNTKHFLRMRTNLDKLIFMADKVYGISQEMCDYYKELYKIDIAPLYKGCSFENSAMHTVNKPIRIVYAGNLLFGRVDTLVTLIDCLEKLNKNGIDVFLDIYSNTMLTTEYNEKLNRTGTSCLHGSISYSEVKLKMASADVVIHVESFEEEQIKKVKYSFSTKIIDCLQSGSVMMAIGPAGISSIEYSKKIPGVIVVDNLSELYSKLTESLVDNKELIIRANKIREFALKEHDIDTVRSSLCEDFKQICQVK